MILGKKNGRTGKGQGKRSADEKDSSSIDDEDTEAIIRKVDDHLCCAGYRIDAIHTNQR